MRLVIGTSFGVSGLLALRSALDALRRAARSEACRRQTRDGEVLPEAGDHARGYRAVIVAAVDDVVDGRSCPDDYEIDVAALQRSSELPVRVAGDRRLGGRNRRCAMQLLSLLHERERRVVAVRRSRRPPTADIPLPAPNG
jgi:hypothetical protein